MYNQILNSLSPTWPLPQNHSTELSSPPPSHALSLAPRPVIGLPPLVLASHGGERPRASSAAPRVRTRHSPCPRHLARHGIARSRRSAGRRHTQQEAPPQLQPVGAARPTARAPSRGCLQVHATWDLRDLL